MLIELKNKNKYGYTELAVVIDTDKKTATLYHGPSAPIGGDWKKASKKAIYNLLDAFADYARKEV